MLDSSKIVEIFYLADEIFKEYKDVLFSHTLKSDNNKITRNREYTLSIPEVMTIIIAFHFSDFRTLKHFYIDYVQTHLQDLFPNTVSYNRFVELQKEALLPLTLMIKTARKGEITGISFIDSTPIRVCKNKRIFNHKVFEGIATRGKSTMGFFFGFKLHIIINDKSEIIDFVITPANTDDREPLKNQSFINNLYGKIYADKGYISSQLVENLFINGIHLITGIRNKMKNKLMSLSDKILLRKRSIIETVNDELKNICQVEHSRHRSFTNFLNNLIGGLIAYSYFPKKPKIRFETEQSNQLTVF